VRISYSISEKDTLSSESKDPVWSKKLIEKMDKGYLSESKPGDVAVSDFFNVAGPLVSHSSLTAGLKALGISQEGSTKLTGKQLKDLWDYLCKHGRLGLDETLLQDLPKDQQDLLFSLILKNPGKCKEYVAKLKNGEPLSESEGLDAEINFLGAFIKDVLFKNDEMLFFVRKLDSGDARDVGVKWKCLNSKTYEIFIGKAKGTLEFQGSMEPIPCYKVSLLYSGDSGRKYNLLMNERLRKNSKRLLREELANELKRMAEEWYGVPIHEDRYIESVKAEYRKFKEDLTVDEMVDSIEPPPYYRNQARWALRKVLGEEAFDGKRKLSKEEQEEFWEFMEKQIREKSMTEAELTARQLVEKAERETGIVLEKPLNEGISEQERDSEQYKDFMKAIEDFKKSDVPGQQGTGVYYYLKKVIKTGGQLKTLIDYNKRNHPLGGSSFNESQSLNETAYEEIHFRTVIQEPWEEFDRGMKVEFHRWIERSEWTHGKLAEILKEAKTRIEFYLKTLENLKPK